MAKKVLILGESGQGKSYSIKNLNEKDTKVISVMKDELPFRNKFEFVKASTFEAVMAEMMNTKKKCIIVDDLQYLLGVNLLHRMTETGFTKFQELSQKYTLLLVDVIDKLPKDTIVYFTSHTMCGEDGKVRIKTVGKAIDQYLTPEGLFNIVLGAICVDGQYYFKTRTSGNDTIKTPEDMFEDELIPNDLKFVDEHIRNYYYMDNAPSDQEIKKSNAKNKVKEEVKELNDLEEL